MKKLVNAAVFGFVFILLLSSVQLAGGQLADSPWPKFQHDLRNTGRSPYRGARDNKLRWSYTVEGSIVAPPVIGAGSTIYFGTYLTNKFYALNPDGTEKWVVLSKGRITSSSAVASNGVIYVGCGDSFNGLCTLNPDGSEKWTFLTDPVWGVLSSPGIAADGTIYFGCMDNKFYALNPNGSKSWSFPTGWRIESSPAIGNDGTIYFGSMDNKFYALNPDGTLKWSYTTRGEIYTAPAIGADGTIYVCSQDSNFYAFYENGSLKWFYPIGRVWKGIAIATDGTIYLGACDNEWNDYIHALRDDGNHATLKWSFPVDRSSAPTPIVDNEGTIYFGSEKTLYALNPDNTVKWTFTVDEDSIFLLSPPVIGADNTIYAATGRTLYAIGTPGEQPEEPSDQIEDTTTVQPDNTALIAAGSGAIVVFLALVFWLRRRRVKPV